MPDPTIPDVKHYGARSSIHKTPSSWVLEFNTYMVTTWTNAHRKLLVRYVKQDPANCSEVPILISTFDSPFEFLTKGLAEESLNRHIELL